MQIKLDRRGFLTWLARGSVTTAIVAAAGQVARFLSYRPPTTTSTILPVGQAGDYAPGDRVYVADARVYVGRDEGGLYALDAVCPHLGCLVEPLEGGGFLCPCHGSRFDRAGGVETGPATQPLRYLALWWDQERGQLFVDRAKEVGATVRLSL